MCSRLLAILGFTFLHAYLNQGFSSALTIKRDLLNSTDLSFSPSACVKSSDRDNDWKDTPHSTTPFPALDQGATSVGVNTTFESTSPPDSPRGPSGGSGLCTEERWLRFNNAAGFYRTKPFLLEDSNVEYHLAWTTDWRSKVIVYIDQGLHSDRWKRIYVSPVGGATGGEFTMSKVEYIGHEIVFEISLNEGDGYGTTGEIALYSLKTFPKFSYNLNKTASTVSCQMQTRGKGLGGNASNTITAISRRAELGTDITLGAEETVWSATYDHVTQSVRSPVFDTWDVRYQWKLTFAGPAPVMVYEYHRQGPGFGFQRRLIGRPDGEEEFCYTYASGWGWQLMFDLDIGPANWENVTEGRIGWTRSSIFDP